MGAKVGDSLPPPLMPTSAPPSLLCKDPEPSLLHALDWVECQGRYVQMLSWWGELTKVLSHEDHHKFTWMVFASFKVPKACNWAKGVDSYYALLLAYSSIGKCHFMLPKDKRFGS